MSNITFVTSLLDIKRDRLESKDFNRPFSRYIETFEKLLAHMKDLNLVVYIDKDLEEVVKKAKPNNLVIKFITTDNLKSSEYYERIQKIRLNEQWRNQVGWLKDSTQANLEFYNPLIFNKIHFLSEVANENPFDTEYFVWIDAGIANAQCHPGYFSKPWLEERLVKQLDKFLFLCFPYHSDTEIHGFSIDAMRKYCKNDSVSRVARGTFFGGNKSDVIFMSDRFRSLSNQTLDEGYMGTEESVYTIMTYLFSDRCNIRMIPNHGLVFDFFEKLQNQPVSVNKNDRTDLYIVTFNSPAQFEFTVDKILKASPLLFENSDKYVVNNSIDRSTDNKYSKLFNQYNFTEFKKDNIGICGARQFIAEHFETTLNKYMTFFEDDMGMNGPEHSDKRCKNGFHCYHPKLYETIIEIMNKEHYDFLKWNFTEFFGDNKTQWAWYNVPQDFREKHWPDKPSLPKHGYDQDAPLCKFTNIKSLNSISYAEGEIYYCNWPQIVSKNGNRKMFLETKWDHPYEQTWMSYIYQKTIQGYIRPALLLLSPVIHNRFDHYEESIRREH